MFEKMLSRCVAVLLAGSVAFLGGCTTQSSSPGVVAAAPQPAQAAPPNPPDAAFTVSGPLIVEHQLDIQAQRDGVVARLDAEPGMRVKAGHLLAELDDRQLRADLDGARAKTRSTEADLKNWELEAKILQSDYDRAKKMWDAQLITKEQLEHTKFKAEADQWDVQRVEQLLANARETERSLQFEMEKTRITAPFAGLVARRYVRAGQQVAKGDRLFWVTAEAPLRMRFTAPERFLGSLRRGQEVPLTLQEFPGEHYTVRIIELGSVVDPASGTFDGMVELLGKPGRARPGMNAVLRIAQP